MPDGVVNIVPGLGSVAGQYIAEHPRHREDRLHRQHGDRPAHRAGERGQPEEGAARARRQGREHRVRRRRPRRRGQRQRLGDLPQPGPGLHRRLAAGAAREDRRRVPRPLHRAGAVDPPRQPARPRHRDGAADEHAAPRPRARLRRRRARAGRRACSRAARRPARELAAGCYVEPTVVQRARPRDRVAQEEVFGPFVTVLTFKNDDEALAIANGTDYGLGSGLWTTQPAARAPLRARAEGRHGLDQQLQARQPGLAVRRRRASAATGARWASTRCASTRRSRASGSTSTRRSRRGIPR